ncbi:hypothetical protein KUTeg_022923 [Tegillarca granosa]|uniref:Heat shock 70 kDa protein 12A n=1 Tax=Tegillarca granosa TaxID=220873 RepID=A0ABQ9E076_TEGGR|nr:hypothetical protein KUTeg_022923 [Tegillarca granosa]
MEISDINGKRQPALKIFSLTINRLKQHLLSDFDRRGIPYKNDDIHWVITVPAIWTDAAKQFMREAANEAGIKNHQLSLAYEPEVAALYCKLLPPDKLGGIDSGDVFSTGKQFMVLDLGANYFIFLWNCRRYRSGSHRKKRDSGRYTDQLEGLGEGMKVDSEFYQFLVKFFGNDLLFEYSQNDMSEYLEILRSFERKKKCISTLDTNEMNLRLPPELLETLKDKTGFTLQEIISQSNYNDSVSVKRSKLTINDYVCKSFFTKVLQDITEHVKFILKQCFDISLILMVGGFSESPIVIDTIRQSFPNMNVIIPTQARMSVLFGSVVYGHDPEQIDARICRYSYGIALHKEFKDEEHPENKSFYSDGRKRVDDCFLKLYTINEIVKVGEKRSFPVHDTHIEADRQQWRREHKEIEVYASTDTDPKFITDEGCFILGTILVPPPACGLWPVRVRGKIEMEIGGTEIIVTYIDNQSHISSRMDFMGICNKTDVKC